MRENFLHFLWRQRRFNLQDLYTTDRQPLEILHPGELNPHAGPDFFNARVRIGDTLWAGNVEMHLLSSEWQEHRHDLDPAYENVILHVVYEDDRPVHRSDGAALPCLVLRNRIPPSLLQSYHRLEHEQSWVPCQAALAETPPIVWVNWLERLLVERLEYATHDLNALLQETGGHWEETYYRRLAWSFGLKVNAQPFLALARALPLKLVGKHRNQLAQVEALVFGQAGMLEEKFEDTYPRQLTREYHFFQHKYGIQPIPASQWKFSRLRPANFPTLRLAQFASMLHHSTHLLAEAMEAPDLQTMERQFGSPLSAYWHNHYRFDRDSAPRAKLSGRDLAHNIVINAVCPMLFLYGRCRHDPKMQQKALELLEKVPPESNTIVDGWAALGRKASNALESQGLLHLKTRYCDAKRCLECAVGNAILK